MSRAVTLKTARDALLLWLIVTAAIIVFEMLLVRAMRDFASDILELWEKRPVIKNLVQMLLGARFSLDISTTGLVTIGLVHPLLLALTWTFILTVGTRVLAGEVDRGTADLLLTLPVSRAAVYVSGSLVLAAALVVLSAAPLLGLALGERVFGLREPLALGRLVIPAANLLAMSLSAAGATLMVSAAASRRGPAVAVVLAALLASFLLNFLAQIWPAAERAGVDMLSLLHYYRPLASVQSGEWPVGDMAVLLGAGALFWVVGLVKWVRRDVPAA